MKPRTEKMAKLPMSLQGQRWTQQTARTIFPLLVELARNRRTITYSDLDTEIQRRGWGHHVMYTGYGHPAGAVGNAIHEIEERWGESIPPINALIVNKSSGLPGHGIDWYIEKYVDAQHRDKMTPENRKSVIRNWLHEDIFRYGHRWYDVLRAMGLEPLEENLTENGEEIQPSRSGWSDEPESEFHRKLADYVASHPSVVGLPPTVGVGVREYTFPSADRADVMFDDGAQAVAVEIKSRISNEADLERGIYQCIKYRALTIAQQQAARRIPNGKAVLVVEEPLSESLDELAKLLRVQVFVHRL